MKNGKWKMDTGLEALAGEGGTSPAKASSPPLIFFTIHYPLSIIH